ncbi:MAG: c-type cytochrome [Bdellovibrionales bacterium]|jgi:mono/diheme cytochrome c family protein|nr:c-type cytochrome [Bdellovibrionales bacterium]
MILERLLILTMFSLISTSCVEEHFKEDVTFVGGQKVTADTLNYGRNVYMENCMACHGDKGDGKGVASKGLLPPPRDLTLGVYKFGHVISGELPTDKDFYRIIKDGLKGTAMLPWDLTQEQLYGVTQYLKTFAMETWTDKESSIGETVVLVNDPWSNNKAEGIARGKEVYHIEAECQSCHRAYATPQELNTMNQKINGEDYDSSDPELYQVKLQGTEYDYMAIPPDFTWHPLRSITNFKDLYLRIASGVGGTTMAAWIEVLEPSDVWAVTHYVNSLIELKETKNRDKLMSKLGTK